MYIPCRPSAHSLWRWWWRRLLSGPNAFNYFLRPVFAMRNEVKYRQTP